MVRSLSRVRSEGMTLQKPIAIGGGGGSGVFATAVRGPRQLPELGIGKSHNIWHKGFVISHLDRLRLKSYQTSFLDFGPDGPPEWPLSPLDQILTE